MCLNLSSFLSVQYAPPDVAAASELYSVEKLVIPFIQREDVVGELMIMEKERCAHE